MQRCGHLLPCASNLINSNIRFLSDKKLPSSASHVVIGGGVVGTSTAYHLSKLGAGDTLLLESGQLTCGTTWHSAAMLNTIRSNVVDGMLYMYTKTLASEVLELETGQNTGFKQHGGLTVTANPEMMVQFQREVDVTKYTGNTAVMVTPEQCKDIFPHLNISTLLGGIYSETDGSVDPTSLTNAYATGATNNGVKIVTGCPVDDILVKNDKVVGVRTSSGDEIMSNSVVVTAGAWSDLLTRKLGIHLPLVASEHSYIVTDIIPNLGNNLPNLRVPDDAIYAKVQNETLYLGAFEANPGFWDPKPFSFAQFDLNMENYFPYLEAFSRHIPMLDAVGHRSIICGPESFSPDGYPLFGETREVQGLFLNCVMNSRGIQMSGGLGREIAELMVNKRTNFDMHKYDVKRFHSGLRSDKSWVKSKTQERHVKTYHVPIPWDQPLAERDKIRSPLHQILTNQGAFFGVTSGWERPEFFLNPESDLSLLDYDWYGYYGHQKHQHYPYRDVLKNDVAKWSPSSIISDAVKSECYECRNNFVIFDSSSLGKIFVSGKDAASALDWVCTNNIANMEPGQCVYTLMLNDEGGVECDLTVTKMPGEEEKYYLATGCAALEHTCHWLSTNLSGEVTIQDVTNQFGVINIQGPESRNFLQKTFPEIKDLNFSRGRIVNFNDVDMMILRLTYVGELGYELHVPRDTCGHVMEQILNCGDKVTFAGTWAMESLAVEAGYHHWPADITQVDTPIEAGMSWVCSKRKNFKGKKRMNEKKHDTLKRKKRICLALPPGSLVTGNECIYRDDEVVGYIRRAETGHTIERKIVYGYVEANIDVNLSAKWQVLSGGQLLDGNIFRRSPYDPDRIKLCK